MYIKTLFILLILSQLCSILSKVPKQYVQLYFKMQDLSSVIRQKSANFAFLGGKKQASFRQVCVARIIQGGLYLLPQITELRSAPKFKNILSLISSSSFKYIIEYEGTGFSASIKGTCTVQPESFSVDQVTYTPGSTSNPPRLRPAGYKNAQFGDSCLARVIQAGLYKLPQIVQNKIQFNQIEYLLTASKSYVITLQKNRHKAIITGICNFVQQSFTQTETSYQYEAQISPVYPLNYTKITGQSVVTPETICFCRLAQIGQRNLMKIIDVKSLNFTRLFQNNAQYVGTKNVIALYEGIYQNDIFLAYYIGSCFYETPHKSKPNPSLVVAGYIRP